MSRWPPFQAVLLRNQTLAKVLARAAVLGLPGWYVVAGCLYQTVWNVVTGQPPEAGILDYPPHESTEAAIDTFEATTACLGMHLLPGGRWRVYAPHGLGDVFNPVVRPNPVLAPGHVYRARPPGGAGNGRPDRSCPGLLCPAAPRPCKSRFHPRP